MKCYSVKFPRVLTFGFSSNSDVGRLVRRLRYQLRHAVDRVHLELVRCHRVERGDRHVRLVGCSLQSDQNKHLHQTVEPHKNVPYWHLTFIVEELSNFLLLCLKNDLSS